MKSYITINLRMPDSMMRALKIKALNEHRRVAELIREAVEQYLRTPFRHSQVREEESPWLAVAGIARTGITDGSVHHDKYRKVRPPRLFKSK